MAIPYSISFLKVVFTIFFTIFAVTDNVLSWLILLILEYRQLLRSLFLTSLKFSRIPHLVDPENSTFGHTCFYFLQTCFLLWMNGKQEKDVASADFTKIQFSQLDKTRWKSMWHQLILLKYISWCRWENQNTTS